MLYFIPAWYQKNEWNENEQNWYMRRMHTEFDDTVKQIQLFHRSKAYPYQMILLSYAPNFRHFLHRQGVYHAPYWSCFDAIQEVTRKQATTLSFHNLNWPADIEFEYTPFVVVAYLHGEKYAQIEFGEDGNPIMIDLYAKGKIQRRNYYDDRGFVSSTLLYDDEQCSHQDYLTEKGVWKLRRYEKDGHVEVNQKVPHYSLVYGGKTEQRNFKRKSYNSLEEVISEVLSAYVEKTTAEDLFCVAMHERHTIMLQRVLKDKKLILSFFEERYDISHRKEAKSLIEGANYLIADSQENVQKIQNRLLKKLDNIVDITPFDSRVDFGISQQINVQKILVPVDGMPDDVFEVLIKYLGLYLLQNENAQIHLFTRQAQYGRKRQLLRMSREALEKAGLESDWAAEIQNANKAENRLEEGVPVRFFVEKCVDELSVSKCMREQRIIVDMRPEVAELYLRITGISVGIPQIVYTETQFVEHGKNGMILQDMSKLVEILDFYLGTLKNWNEAMVYSYELGQKYTTRMLIEKWKEVIERVRKNSNFTTGDTGLE